MHPFDYGIDEHGQRLRMKNAYRGVLPAIPVPMSDNYEIDEPELQRYSKWLAAFSGVTGIVTNGQADEVLTLTAEERVRVTSVVVDAVKGRVPVISGIACENIEESTKHAKMAKNAGAEGLLVLPRQYWLRFGYRHEQVLKHFVAIGRTVDINLIADVYSKWGKASYSPDLLRILAALPWVTAFKMRTSDMRRYEEDIRLLRSDAPDTSILTGHDEFLLASMVQGVDGALVDFAAFLPDLVTGLFDAVKCGDLHRAQEIQARILPLKEVIYHREGMSGEHHARMKSAMAISGRLKSAVVRPPLKQPAAQLLEKIEREVNWCEIEAESTSWLE